ncbi:hypothetical protein Tco_0989613 [Tanacetum coccineum]|uniref:Uncharacterized protein n=1 Tax=Tanacetum coccineum TaxID=301880 RepID=A0ABQ5EUC0_9ASTR
MHKEVQQATSGPTSLGVTSEEGAHPQLSSVVSASLTKPVYSASTILHSESASGHEASTTSTTEANPEKTYPNDSISQQQGIVKRTKNFSLDHIFAGTDPYALVEKTKSASEGLETVLTQPATGKGASYVKKEITFVEKDASFGADEFLTSPDLSSSDDTKKEIKLQDLSKLVLNLDVDFIDLDSPEDDQPIIVEDEEEEEVHAEIDDAKKSQNYKLEQQKLKAKAKVAFLLAQPSFLKVEKHTELLVKSLSLELSKLLSSHDFSSSLLTELKELPSNATVSSLTTQVAELKTLLWELPAEFLSVPGQVSSVQAKIKTLDALPSLLSKSSPQPKRELIKKDKGKKAMSLKDAKEEGTESEYDDVNLTSSMIKSSKQKKLKQFDFITRKGEHIHLTAD